MKTKKIKIKDLKPGMKIKSYCPETQKTIFQKVEDVWNTEVKEADQVRLEFTNGTVVNCSVNHPIMVLENDKVVEKKPSELTGLDLIITDNEDTARLYKRTINQPHDTSYIDITVANTNTFFTQESLDSPMVLTHNSQGGVRGGAATTYFPLWHYEIENLLVLKNNKGTEDNRVRHMDYGVQLNKLMYERLLTKGYITLFSPNEVPGLYDAFFQDQKQFKKLYEKYENSSNPKIRKKTIKATDIFSSLMTERAATGRIYIQNVDHCNTHSAFNPEFAPVYMSNLCLEILLPTKPLKNVNDPEGEIALCTLSAFNLGAIEDLTEIKELSDLIVRALDSLLDFQDYPIPAAFTSSKNRRTLGIGVTNFAYYLAKNGIKYDDGSANELTHRTFETIQYYLLQASNQLAKELGKCTKFEETTYAQGKLPIDTYKKDINEFCKVPLQYDWEALRSDILKYGLRNSTLSAQMPCETSSQITNSTNGIEPPRGFVAIKQSKEGILAQVVPDYETLKDNYQLLWSIKDNKGYLQLVAIMQKFMDQSISANTNYNPAKFKDNKVPMGLLLEDLILAYRYGLKTLYYHNTNDGSDDNQDLNGPDCSGGACKL